MASSKCPRPLAVQTLIFSKSEFEPFDVFAWCEQNRVHIDPRQLLETGQSYRFRQHDPSRFIPGSLRTIRLGKGESRVQAVVGCPTQDLRDHILASRAETKRLKTGKGRGPSLPAASFKGLTPAERRAEQAKLAAQKRPGLAKTKGGRGWGKPVRTAATLEKLLAHSPPAPGTSLRQYAAEHGITLASSDRRIWNARKRAR
jgi:hypothetical protein